MDKHLTGTCRNGHPWATSAYLKKNGKMFCKVCCNKRRQERRSLALRFPERVQPAEVRLLLKLDKTSGHGPWGDCWVFTGSKPNGYGQISKDGKLVLAHRLSYEMAYGPIADGLGLLHRCDNPPCCRPDHLIPGTQAANVADAVRKGRAASKLTWEQVRRARSDYANGEKNQRELAIRYGVSLNNMHLILNHRTWKEAA